MIERFRLGDWVGMTAWRVRGSAGPRVHLQAGVHADEIPGMLVLHHLLPRLIAAERDGRLRGEVTVVPHANPIGSRQFAHGRLLGRFDQATGHNFNRDFPAAASRAQDALVYAWQAALLTLSADADIVLDLHTDDEALPYLYVHATLWPASRDLAAALGAAVVITWDSGGGGAFEDAIVGLRGAALNLCSTVELRGQADVDDDTAAGDADGIYRLLQARGVLEGPVDLPPWRGEAVDIAHIQTIRAPRPGILVFLHGLGARLPAGEPFARLVPLPGDPSQDVALAAPGPGLLFTRARDRFVAAGHVVAKLTGDAASGSFSGNPLDD